MTRIDAFENAVLTAHETADAWATTRRDAASLEAVDAEGQAAIAASLLADPAHAHTPWGAHLAAALEEAIAMRLAHDALAAAREAEPTMKNALRRWAATDETPSGFGGGLGWADPTGGR